VARRKKIRDKAFDQKATLDNRAIGLRVMKLRERLGLTTTELASKVDMSQAQISRLENGKQGFRSHTLAKIAESLGVKPIYFFIENKKVTTADVVKENTDQYGPGVPAELREAMNSPRFKRFAAKSAKIFMEDESTFSKLSTLVRKTKV